MNYVTVYIDLIVICILSTLLIIKVDACIFYGPFWETQRSIFCMSSSESSLLLKKDPRYQISRNICAPFHRLLLS